VLNGLDRHEPPCAGPKAVGWPEDIDSRGPCPLEWQGQNFDHGLGHGVGAYLSVHERAATAQQLRHVLLSDV